MKAFLFAAAPDGMGLPDALAPVRGRPLIVWHILNLVRAGISDIVIAAPHQALQAALRAALQDGSTFGAQLQFGAADGPAEMGAAIAAALPLLGPEPFVALPAHIHCPHFDFSEVQNTLEERDAIGNFYTADERDIGWLYLVSNPPGASGDFSVLLYTLACDGAPRYTFSGIGVYRPELFGDAAATSLPALLRAYAARGRLGGEVYGGAWCAVQDEAALAALNAPAPGRQGRRDA